MNFIDMINDVLIRLRESQISSIGETQYSALIGRYLNDAKRRVEAAHNWSALTSTSTVTTMENVAEYILDDVGTRFKVIDVYSQTYQYSLACMPAKELTRAIRMTPQSTGPVTSYGFNGVATSGESGSTEQRADMDPVVTLFPIPRGTETIHFDVYSPTDALVEDIDVPLVPAYLLVDYAYAKAIAERGEDGALASSEAIQLWNSDLSDEIALETSRFPEAMIWTPE